MKASLTSGVWYPAPNALMSAEVLCIRNLCSVIISEKIKKGFSVLLRSQFYNIPFNVLKHQDWDGHGARCLGSCSHRVGQSCLKSRGLAPALPGPSP